MKSTIKESIHDAVTTIPLMLGFVFLLAAMVNLCSCSSYRKSVHAQTSEQTDTAFQRTRQLDLSVSRLVASKDSGWSRIVIFDTSLPMLELTGLPPVKAIIETGNAKMEETSETAITQTSDSVSAELHREIERKEDSKEKKTGDTGSVSWLLWGFFIGVCLIVIITIKVRL